MHTIKKLTFISIFMLLPAASVEAGSLEPVVKAAKRAAKRNEQVKACELYLGLLPRLDHATERDRLLVLRGLHETVQALAAKGLKDTAVKGLIGLLQATSGPLAQKVPGPGFAKLIREQMDGLGFDLLRRGNPELAARLLRALVADGPSPALRWALLARATMRSGEFEKAQETIKRGLAIFPGSPELLFSRADLFGYLSLRAVIRSNYMAAEHLLLRANKDLDRALKKEKAAGIYRAKGRISASLWNFYAATGRYEQAMKLLDEAELAYENASMLDPSDSVSMIELGDLLFSAGDYHWAKQTFKKACNTIAMSLGKKNTDLLKNKIATLELSRCKEREKKCVRRIKSQIDSYRRSLDNIHSQVQGSEISNNSAMPNTSVRFSMIVGQLKVDAFLPPFMDPGDFRVELEKAHAITMAAFPNRLVGPLEVKVFADRGSYLRLLGLPVRRWLDGTFEYGKVLTFYDPERSRMKWIQTLVGGLTFRYVDEMTYHNSPTWLSDGMAQLVAMGWSGNLQREFVTLMNNHALLPWSGLDEIIDGTWTSAEMSARAHLQAHQMVSWLYGRFGQRRVWNFLAQLRGGRSVDAASSAAFGKKLADLEELWQRDSKNAI